MIRGAWENACMRGGADLHVREPATLQDCSFAVCDFRGNWHCDANGFVREEEDRIYFSRKGGKQGAVFQNKT